MKKLLIAIILLCSLQTKAQYLTSTTWYAFVSRYKTDTATSNTIIRKQDATINLLMQKVQTLETALSEYKLIVVDQSVIIGDTIKANLDPIYKSIINANLRIDSVKKSVPIITYPK